MHNRLTEEYELPDPEERFQHLTEKEVLESLLIESNPVVDEVARLAAEWLQKLNSYADEHGYIPPHFLYPRIEWAIQKVAMQAVIAFIKSPGSKFQTLQ